MNEQIYKEMGKTGTLNLVMGIFSIIGGITGGVLLIIYGAKLFKTREKMLL